MKKFFCWFWITGLVLWLIWLLIEVIVQAQPVAQVRRINDLLDVRTASAPSAGAALVWNGTKWTNGAPSGTGVASSNLLANSFTTNNPAKGPVLLSTTTSPLYPLMVLLPDGSGSDRSLQYAPNFFMSNGVAHFVGNVMLSGLTPNTLLRVDAGNLLNNVIGGSSGALAKWTGTGTIGNSVMTDDGTTLNVNNLNVTNSLLIGGVPVSTNSGAAGTTNFFDYTYISNFFSQFAYISNLFTVNGKNNTVFITNSITLGDYYLYAIKPGTGITFTTNANPTSGTNITIAGPSIGTGLTLSGGVLTRNALTGDVTTSGDAATIAANAVTLPKLVNATATQRVLGRNTAGSGNWEEVTATQELDWIGSTRGQILYRGASAWTALGAGTSGYILTAAGAGADPAWAAAPSSGLVTSASQFAIVGGSASGTANGTALLAAYVVAQTATPNGNALAANNRYVILLLPGVYDLGSSTLTMDTAFVDIVGLGDPAWQSTASWSSTDNGNTIITSSSGTATITVSASSNEDVLIARVALVNSGSGKAYKPNADTDQNTKLIQVLIVNTGSAGNDSMPENRTFAGLYIDVISRNPDSFATGTGDASGKFYRCKSKANSFGGSWSGGTGTASGQFWDCEADGDSFGKQTSSGKFFRCRMVNTGMGGDVFGLASGGTASGTYIECQGGDGTASFGGNAGTMSGVMIGCFPSTGVATTLAQASVTGEIRNCPLYTGWNGPYAMNTADSTQISNTASESNFSTTKSIAASAWKVGRAFRWEAWGKYSCTNVSPGTIIFKTKFGSTAANTSDTLTLPAAGAANLGWTAHGMFTCRTIGGSGTVSSQSAWEMDQGTLGVLNESIKPSNGTTTIANNGSLTFQISVTFSAASASNAATLENFLVQPLDAN